MNDNINREILAKLRARERQYCPSRTYFQSDNKMHFTQFNSIQQTQLTNTYEEAISKLKQKPLFLDNTLKTYDPHDKFSRAYYLQQPIGSTVSRNEKIDMINELDLASKNYDHLKDPNYDPIKLPYIDFSKRKQNYKIITNNQKVDTLRLLSPQFCSATHNNQKLPKLAASASLLMNGTLRKCQKSGKYWQIQ
ncbi:hypothetical protein SS50377_28116 [Spironucleus salmonicida]|uniref:Uncharacterized protein n=1 Tax=Spironucleus salmonicida TaxID=348837 RepID=A0A9P8RV26_9EUKA|nr:hypothetical protein SS50377_28116 [Spironucleus salmonicida]